MKKGIATFGVLLASTLLLTACGNSGDTSSKSSTSKSSKVEKAVNKATKKKAATTSIPTDADHDWFFKDNIFYAGNETMTFKSSEVRDGVEDGTKVLVLHTTILNNSKEEQDPSNFYMVLHAKQKTDTSNVDLSVGMLASDENGNSPFQEEEDNLNNALLPGKQISTVLMFELKNDNPVTIELSNADFTTIGTKVIDVK